MATHCEDLSVIARRPPPHVTWLFRHGLIGFAIGVALGLTIIAFDVGQLRTLSRQDGGAIALFVLCFFCGLTCGGVQIGLAIMALGDDDGDDGHRQTAPVRVAAARRR
jgi:hypothetical protein